MTKSEYIRLEAQKELARRYFYDYCRLKYPKHYLSDRLFLQELCERLQAFTEQNEKRFLVVNMPPRHYKSFTGTNLVEWLFGKHIENDPKIMTGSYNETLSTTFARKVRDTIEEEPVVGGNIVYRDIFPKTKVKYGQASASKWALEGSSQDNYLATSPTGTATGFGANIILIDDIIKNAEEAYNEAVLEKHYLWFTNTMLSRTEGNDWKVILIMTRWATNDLSGRILSSYENVEHIDFRAEVDKVQMLCDSILTRSDFELKTQEMNEDIVQANYNQKPIDIEGRLYGEFMSWSRLPEGEHKRYNKTDTADKGSDFLCSVNYIENDGDVYITDLYISDEAMEVTEQKVAELLDVDGIQDAEFESNNGGRGFARNIERILKERGTNRCVITDKAQTKNKESRILASSSWVNKHVYMPPNWKIKYPQFYKQVFSYQRKGKNKHDDAPDVLASIYESVANPYQMAWASADQIL